MVYDAERNNVVLFGGYDLEGIVAKPADAPYDAGKRRLWLKVKNPEYSQKEGRAELFNSRR